MRVNMRRKLGRADDKELAVLNAIVNSVEALHEIRVTEFIWVLEEYGWTISPLNALCFFTPDAVKALMRPGRRRNRSRADDKEDAVLDAILHSVDGLQEVRVTEFIRVLAQYGWMLTSIKPGTGNAPMPLCDIDSAGFV